MSYSLPSKNVFGADNQQERLKIAYWRVDFTDEKMLFPLFETKLQSSENNFSDFVR